MSSTDTTDSLAESDNGPSTAKTVTQPVSLLDVVRHAQSEVAQAGARPFAYEHKLRTETLARPPMMYQSANVTKLDGFEAHGTAVAPAVTALDAMHAALASIIDARGKSERDPTLVHSQASQVLAVADYADKQIDAVTRKVDAAHQHIQAQITAAEAELSKSIPASGTPLSGEVRAHAKAQKNPVQFVSQLIADGDEQSVSAILGAPAYLSGLTNDMRAALTRAWHSKRNPALTAKLTLLQATDERLSRAGSAFVTSAEKAQGVNYKLIKQLRDAKAAATF